MTTPTIASPSEDQLDDFEFDIRITVQADPAHPDASFTIWLSCKGGSCNGTCGTLGYTCSECH